MPKSWRDRVMQYMLEHGYTEVQSPSKKYRAFHPGKIVTRDDVKRTYFVGYSGAVRVSNHGTISDARSVTATFHKMVLYWEAAGKAQAAKEHA